MRENFLNLLKSQKENGFKPYQLNHPASAEDVENTEKRLGIKLPKDYRDFLLTVGNGGSGPRNLYPIQGVNYMYDLKYICIGDGGCGFFHILDCATEEGQMGSSCEGEEFYGKTFSQWYEEAFEYTEEEIQKQLKKNEETINEIGTLPSNIADWKWNPYDTHRFYSYLSIATKNPKKYSTFLFNLSELPHTYPTWISLVEEFNKIKLFDLSLKALDKAMNECKGEDEEKTLICLKVITLVEKGDVAEGLMLVEDAFAKGSDFTSGWIEYKYQVPLALAALKMKKFKLCGNVYKNNLGEMGHFIWQACVNHFQAELSLEFITFIESNLKTKKLAQLKKSIEVLLGDLSSIEKIDEGERHQMVLYFFNTNQYANGLTVAKTLQKSKDPQWVSNITGCCLMGLQRYAEALEAFKKSYAFIQWAVPGGNIGHAYVMMGELEKAKTWLDKCLYYNPYDEWPHYFMAIYYLKINEPANIEHHVTLAKKYGFTINNLKLSNSDDQVLMKYWPHDN